jgi:hypothetical protein
MTHPTDFPLTANAAAPRPETKLKDEIQMYTRMEMIKYSRQAQGELELTARETCPKMTSSIIPRANLAKEIQSW